jgi:hypothetical protein
MMSEASSATHNVAWHHATVTRTWRERMSVHALGAINYENSRYIIKNKCSHYL